MAWHLTDCLRQHLTDCLGRSKRKNVLIGSKLASAVAQPHRGRLIKKAKFQYFRGGQIARHQFASAASEKKAHEVGFFFREFTFKGLT